MTNKSNDGASSARPKRIRTEQTQASGVATLRGNYEMMIKLRDRTVETSGK